MSTRSIYAEIRYPGDYVRELRWASPMKPMDAWMADSLKKPERVKVTHIRGHVDNPHGDDWAEIVGGRVVPTHYLFPVKGYRKPQLMHIVDQYGTTRQWVAIPKGMTEERAARLGVTATKPTIAESAGKRRSSPQRPVPRRPAPGAHRSPQRAARRGAGASGGALGALVADVNRLVR